ncbi:hypothetical protein DS830_05685 [Bombilactobacillus bombi]|uniref:pectate lyase-like adhesive domain-containing protein n=1 Tax=Bombilactobacillus bombi TaxID=1303590 RepID=UPI000E589BAC|nr:pectate lyase-like adhesive domain-containing protein [Bombilactobacillus bombi]AXX64992.1 hypothetical protein DS830_05685 [Bombilactobacillus bombi]
MKYTKPKYLILVLTIVLTLIGCCQYLNNPVQAKVKPITVSANNENMTTNLHNLVNPQSTLNTNLGSSNLYMPSGQTSSLLRTWQWPADEDETHEFALEPDPEYPLKEIDDGYGNKRKVRGYIAHVQTAKQFLQALLGSYDVDIHGNVMNDDNHIPYKYAQANEGANARGQEHSYSDITKIVLEKDINLPNANNEPKLYVRNYKGEKVEAVIQSTSASTAGGNNSVYFVLRRFPSEKEETDAKGQKRIFSHLIIDGHGIDGKDHKLNLGQFTLQTWTPSSGPRADRENQDITYQNITVYGNSYYGLLDTSIGNARETYRNINYYGAQFAYGGNSSNTVIYIAGTTNAYSLHDYNAPDGKNYICQTNAIGGGDQQNIQAKDIVFKKNCIYNGYTYSGNTIQLSGDAILEEGATVNLFPHTEDHVLPEAPPASGMSAGLSLSDGSAKVKMGKDSKLNVISDGLPLSAKRTISTKDPAAGYDYEYDVPQMPAGTTDDSKASYTNAAIGLYMNGTDKDSGIYFEKDSNAVINVNSTIPLKNNVNLITVRGGTANIGEGALLVEAENLNVPTANYNLLAIGAGANVYIGKDGIFDLSAPHAQGNVNMVNTLGAGTFKINVYQPKLLRIVTPEENKKAYLVNGTGVVEMHGVKAQAIGHTWASQGLGDATVNLKTTPFEYLNLPFRGTNLITGLDTSVNNQMGVESNQSSLGRLSKTIQSMIQPGTGLQRNIREFDSITVTAIDAGPQMQDQTPTLHGDPSITPDQRFIKGTITDREQNKPIVNTDSQNSNYNNPDARLHVVLNHKDGTTVDLGTKTDEERDIVDPLATALSPNPSKFPIAPDDYDWGNQEFPALSAKGKALYKDKNDVDAKGWQYLDNTVKGLVTWDTDNKNYQIDIDKVLEQYNTKNPNNKIEYLTGTDTITVTSEYAFQASQVSTIKVATLNLRIDSDKVKKQRSYYLLGEDLQIPLQYQENASKADPTLTVNSWYFADPNNLPDKLDSKKPTASTTYSVQQKVTSWTDLDDWKIPAAKATNIVGNHTIKLYGADDANGQSPSFDIDANGQFPLKALDFDEYTYNYNVLNVPGYTGERTFKKPDLHYRNDRSKDTPIDWNEPLPMGIYYEHNVFTPKSDTAPISNFEFTRNGDDKVAIKGSTLVIVDLDNPTNTVSLSNFEYGKNYNTSDRRLSKLVDGKSNHFKKNIQFKIYTKVQITDVPDITLGTITLSTENDNKNINLSTVDLGSIAAQTKGSIQFLQLTVPKTIDYGSHTSIANQNEKYEIANVDDVKSNLILNYDPNVGKSSGIQVYARIMDDEFWDNALSYNDGKKTSYIGNDLVLIYDSGKIQGANLGDPVHHIKLANEWWNSSGKQSKGLFMETQAPRNPHMGQPHSKLEWQVVNSI